MRDPATDPHVDPASLTESDWQTILDPAQFAILRRSATERAWTGPWLDHQAPGAYHCAGCGHLLYASAHKFHSGCGWPSFFREAAPGALETVEDRSHGMTRTEMRCARCHGHLGHIFDDAPQTPTGARHCVNGHALLFVPSGADPVAAIAGARRT